MGGGVNVKLGAGVCVDCVLLSITDFDMMLQIIFNICPVASSISPSSSFIFRCLVFSDYLIEILSTHYFIHSHLL